MFVHIVCYLEPGYFSNPHIPCRTGKQADVMEWSSWVLPHGLCAAYGGIHRETYRSISCIQVSNRSHKTWSSDSSSGHKQSKRSGEHTKLC